MLTPPGAQTEGKGQRAQCRAAGRLKPSEGVRPTRRLCLIPAFRAEQSEPGHSRARAAAGGLSEGGAGLTGQDGQARASSGHPRVQFSWGLRERRGAVRAEGFPGGAVRENPPADARDAGLVPGLGRSPGGRNGNPPQHSCLENSADRGGAWWATVHGVAKSRARLSGRLSEGGPDAGWARL